jgi:hypothetical protein
MRFAAKSNSFVNSGSRASGHFRSYNRFVQSFDIDT